MSNHNQTRVFLTAMRKNRKLRKQGIGWRPLHKSLSPSLVLGKKGFLAVGRGAWAFGGTH